MSFHQTDLLATKINYQKHFKGSQIRAILHGKDIISWYQFITSSSVTLLYWWQHRTWKAFEPETTIRGITVVMVPIPIT